MLPRQNKVLECVTNSFSRLRAIEATLSISSYIVGFKEQNAEEIKTSNFPITIGLRVTKI
jgi:hypothetical protein